MKKRGKTEYGKKIAVLGILTALGLVSFLLEALIPTPLPGMKLGVANVFSFFALLVYGLPEALLVCVARTVLGSLFAGNLSMILYSTTAGIASILVSRLLLCFFPRVSILCTSVASALAHNLVQLLVYCAVTRTMLLFSYAPYLCALGAVAGIAVGCAVVSVIKALPSSFFADGTEHNASTEELH